MRYTLSVAAALLLLACATPKASAQFIPGHGYGRSVVTVGVGFGPTWGGPVWGGPIWQQPTFGFVPAWGGPAWHPGFGYGPAWRGPVWQPGFGYAPGWGGPVWQPGFNVQIFRYR